MKSADTFAKPSLLDGVGKWSNVIQYLWAYYQRVSNIWYYLPSQTLLTPARNRNIQRVFIIALSEGSDHRWRGRRGHPSGSSCPVLSCQLSGSTAEYLWSVADRKPQATQLTLQKKMSRFENKNFLCYLTVV